MRILLLLSLALAACAGPEPEAPGPGRSSPSAESRRVVDRCPAPRPAWLEKGSFPHLQLPRVQCFVGAASTGGSLAGAEAAAEADARKRAGDFMGSQVTSAFERGFRAKVAAGRSILEETIQETTSQIASHWLERAVRTESWWERLADGTWEAWVLIQVPEQSLNPLTALTRELRLRAMRAQEPEDRIACCDGILALHLADRHALYVKARALEDLGRRGDAVEMLRRLRGLNRGPRLGLPGLYREIGLEPSPGGIDVVDLDEDLFRLAPHWEDALNRLEALVRDKASPGALVLRLNQTKFRTSEYGPESRPVLIGLDFPEGRKRPVVLLWVDQASLCQANPAAPAAEVPEKPWLYPLAERKGEVLLIALAGTEEMDLVGLDLAFERGIEREAVRKPDRDAVNRLERVLRVLEDMARQGTIVAAALARFTQE